MGTIVIRTYRERGDASRRAKELVCRVDIPDKSRKKLTASRALRFLRAHAPGFGNSIYVIKSKNGWSSSRAVEPLPRCSYQFIWEHAVISET
jgi:hypothetical protein